MRSGRILFLGRGVYDYLEATLIEGLIDTGYEVEGLSAANNISNVINIESITPPYDFIFVNHQSLRAFQQTLSSIREGNLILVDGRDDPYISLTGLLKVDLYLKRELLTFPVRPRSIRQISFGIEKRYYEATKPEIYEWASRPIDIFCAASLGTNKARRRYTEAVIEFGMKHNLRVFGTATGERAYDNRSGSPIPTPIYHQALGHSKIAISLFGAGQDCARFWECLASGTLLISEKVHLADARLPREGQEALYFRNKKELIRLLSWVAEHPIDSVRIAQAGHRWGLQHGSTRAVVERLTKLKSQIVSLNVLARSLYVLWGIAYNMRACIYLQWYKRLRHRFI